MRYLVFDMSNILHRSFHMIKGEDISMIKGLVTNGGVASLNKYFKMFSPDGIIATFDRANWRKTYTKSDKCVSGLVYKGGRNKDKTKSELEKLKELKDQMVIFEDMLRKHSSIVCMGEDDLEADDIIAGITQELNDEIIIISSDKDLMQLLTRPEIKLVTPQTDKMRSLADWNDDPKLFLYEKTFRGENGNTGDNIQNAYPRLRRTKILEAYNDPFKHENLMNETWVNQHKVEFRVGDLIKENNLLMGLTAQPKHIRKKMKDVIEKSFDNVGKFSLMRFRMYLGKRKFRKLSDNIMRYVDVLSCGNKNSNAESDKNGIGW